MKLPKISVIVSYVILNTNRLTAAVPEAYSQLAEVKAITTAM